MTEVKSLEQIFAEIDKDINMPHVVEITLPRQVEVTCDVFEKQFLKTADRCDRLADKLQGIIDNLNQYSNYLREQAKELPETMTKAVRAEREYSGYAAFFEPLIKQ